MRKYAVALMCLAVGCVAGSAMPTITAQTFGPNPSAPRREQFCENGGIRDSSKNDLLRRRGLEGWEFVEHWGESTYVCFKRPVAR